MIFRSIGFSGTQGFLFFVLAAIVAVKMYTWEDLRYNMRQYLENDNDEEKYNTKLDMDWLAGEGELDFTTINDDALTVLVVTCLTRLTVLF